MTRVVPPAWSPVGWATIAAAIGGVARGRRAVASLEADLAARFAAATAIGTDSGTTALRLAIAAATGGNSPVALPAWGCFDLATAADGAGSPVVLFDIDPSTLGPDWASLERALAAGATALVIVHPFGLPVDVERAAGLARASGAVLIEDAAQAAGALIGSRPAGSFGDFTVLSFGRGKGLTGGGGGALLVRAPDAAIDRSRLAPAPLGARSVVVTAALLVASRPSIYGLLAGLPFLGLGKTPYHPPHPPAGLSPAAAGAVRETLGRLDRSREDRGRVAGRLAAAARALEPAAVPAPTPGSTPGYLRFPVLVGRGMERVAAAASLGVMPGYPRALPDLPGFAERIAGRGEAFPGARRLAAELVTLPTHRWVTPGDLDRLERWLGTVLPGVDR